MDEKQLTNELEILKATEQYILSVALKSPNALPDILMHLNENDFFNGAHKLIFKAIENLNSNSKEISELTVADELELHGNLEKAGNTSYILQLGSQYYTDENIEAYIQKIYQASAERKFKDALKHINVLTQESKDMRVVLEQAQKDLLEIDFDYKKNDTVTIYQSAENVIQRIRKLAETKERLTGVTTGYSRLDAITAGLQPQDFIILAARPSMGKTAFALNLAYNAATDAKQGAKNGVAIFSLEMPADQLTQRIISMMTDIEGNKLRHGQGITKEEWDDLGKAQDYLQKAKIFIDDTPGITVQQIQSKLYKLKRDEDINLCVIDYLQLITTPGSNGGDRQNEISNISRQLKRIARDTGVTIVCLSQLSRSVEKREDKRPIMSDLRDSGAIEQDADMIMFLYREEYYKNKDEESLEEAVSPTELIIAKHRNGATGTVNLSFLKKVGKFING